MFIIQRNSLFLLVFSLLISFNALAQEQDELKEFLSSSEFGIQRKVIKEGSIGQKGLTGGSIQDTDIKDVLIVDLIDPFANITIVGTKTDLEHLDDGIEIKDDELLSDSINSFRGRIEDYFAEIENQEDVNIVELLDHLIVSQIISSPIKYLVIQGRKYKESDIIKVKVNRFGDDSEFQAMLDSIEVQTEDTEEAKLLEDLKREAIDRYANLTSLSDNSLSMVKIKINEITKHQVSFIIDEKEYKLVMKK